MTPAEFLAQVLRPPCTEAPPIVFIEARQRMPIGHRFEAQGRVYETTCWQFPTPLGFKIALILD